MVADAGWQVGEWVRHVLERTEGVEPGSVQMRRECRLQTGLRYKSSETQTVHELQVDNWTRRRGEWTCTQRQGNTTE